MQKKLLAVAVLSAFSGLAAAQSANVTLYGTLQNELQMREATGADDQVQPAAASGARSAYRSTASYTTNPTNYSSRMASQSAGSNFGIRGTEDLGNGLSAFFQLELATTIGGPNAFTPASGGTAATYRNTGLGLRSTTWGSVMFGQWDVPFDTIGNNTINGATSGPTTNVIYSILGGNAAASGSVSGQTFDQMCNAATVAVASSAAGLGAGGAALAVPGAGASPMNAASSCLNHAMNFSRRQSGQLQWWSPNWNGFEVRVGYVPTQFTTAANSSNPQGVLTAAQLASTVAFTASGATVPTGSLTSLRPSQWDLAASYTNGGLRIVGSYQAKKDYVAQAVRLMYATTGNTGTNVASGQLIAIGNTATGGGNIGLSQDISGSKDRGYRLGASYRFGMGLTLGALYENLKWNMSYNTIGAGAAANVTELKNTAWRLQANYATGKHTFTGEYAKKSDTKIAIDNAAVTANDGSSGAKSWILGYNYAFSKRTSMLGYYMSIVNDTNAAYGPTFGGIGGSRGADHKYYGVGLRHAF